MIQTTNIGLYTAAQWAVPILGKKEVEDKPSFFVTSSLLWKRPFPMYFSLSLVKTSQRNLVQSLVMSYLGIYPLVLPYVQVDFGLPVAVEKNPNQS